MEDSPNEVQNIASPTKIDEVDEPKTVEELQKKLTDIQKDRRKELEEWKQKERENK